MFNDVPGLFRIGLFGAEIHHPVVTVHHFPASIHVLGLHVGRVDPQTVLRVARRCDFLYRISFDTQARVGKVVAVPILLDNAALIGAGFKDVISVGKTRDVDPLTIQPASIDVSPARRDALIRTGKFLGSRRATALFDVHQAEGLLQARPLLSLAIVQGIVVEMLQLVMPMTGKKYVPLESLLGTSQVYVRVSSITAEK